MRIHLHYFPPWFITKHGAFQDLLSIHLSSLLILSLPALIHVLQPHRISCCVSKEVWSLSFVSPCTSSTLLLVISSSSSGLTSDIVSLRIFPWSSQTGQMSSVYAPPGSGARYSYVQLCLDNNTFSFTDLFSSPYSELPADGIASLCWLFRASTEPDTFSVLNKYTWNQIEYPVSWIIKTIEKHVHAI